MIVVVSVVNGSTEQFISLFWYFTQVIGDKKGTTTSRTLRNPQNLKLLEEIETTLETQLKFIHVMRNPFDNIATKLLRNLDARDMARDKQNFKVRLKLYSNILLVKSLNMKIIGNQRAKAKRTCSLKIMSKKSLFGSDPFDVFNKIAMQKCLSSIIYLKCYKSCLQDYNL